MSRRYLFSFVCLMVFAALASAQPKDKVLTRIAFGSCVDQDKECPIWDKITDLKPDLMLLLGDNIYADIENGRLITPHAERIKEKYDIQAKVPGYRKLVDSVPILAMWDDHDYGLNDAGAEWPHKDISQTYFLDFFGVPKDDPRRARKGVYHSAIFGPEGKRVQIILMDGRYHRSELKKGPRAPQPGYGGSPIAPYLPNNDPAATMLGDEQWKWLEEQLKQPADIRLLCSGTQVISEEHPFEKWGNFPLELARLYKLINDTKANGVIILSGDRHLADLSVRTDVAGYPLFDVTSSGFNQGSKNWRQPEKNKYRIGGMPYGDNFGTVLIEWGEKDTKIQLQIRDDHGDVNVSHTCYLGQLKHKPAGKEKPKKDAPLKADLPRPEGVITPAVALTMVGKEVTVQYVPGSGRATGMGDKKRMFLNSEKDFKSETNLTIMLTGGAFAAKYKDATFDTFKDKTIRVKGTVKLFQNKPEIEVTDEKQIEIVEK